MSRIIKIEIKNNREVPFVFQNKTELKKVLKYLIDKIDYSKDKKRFDFLVNSIWNIGRGFWPAEEITSSMFPNLIFKANHSVKPLVLPTLRGSYDG